MGDPIKYTYRLQKVLALYYFYILYTFCFFIILKLWDQNDIQMKVCYQRIPDLSFSMFNISGLSITFIN